MGGMQPVGRRWQERVVWPPTTEVRGTGPSAPLSRRPTSMALGARVKAVLDGKVKGTAGEIFYPTRPHLLFTSYATYRGG